MCSVQFTTEFRLKTANKHTSDDTSVNAIEIKCISVLTNTEVATRTSGTQRWGDWWSSHNCSADYWIVAFQVGWKISFIKSWKWWWRILHCISVNFIFMLKSISWQFKMADTIYVKCCSINDICEWFNWSSRNMCKELFSYKWVHCDSPSMWMCANYKNPKCSFWKVEVINI